MSSRLATIVWDHYPEGGGELLTALALAEHGDPDGTNVYPSVETIAKMTQQSERTIQYHIKKMVESCWLLKVKQGGGRGRPTKYRVPIEWIPQHILGTTQKLHSLSPPTSDGVQTPQEPRKKGAETVQENGANGATRVAPDQGTNTKDHDQGNAEPPSASPPFLAIPLVGKQGEFTVTEADVAQWQESFPGIDVRQLLRKIRQWNIDNPAKRKTKSGIRGHISRWLGKEQDTNPKKAPPAARTVDTSCTEETSPGQLCGMPGERDAATGSGFICAHHKQKRAERSREIPPAVKNALAQFKGRRVTA